MIRPVYVVYAECEGSNEWIDNIVSYEGRGVFAMKNMFSRKYPNNNIGDLCFLANVGRSEDPREAFVRWKTDWFKNRPNAI